MRGKKLSGHRNDLADFGLDPGVDQQADSICLAVRVPARDLPEIG
jgi:hypothetical protein